jgi:phthalate 4,5-cis-dihydrodiol dehydrogenase
LRVGVAGLGSGAVNALAADPGLRHHPHVQLTAAADPRPVARASVESQFGVQTFSSVEEMCALGEIDAVYILTPSALHAQHAIIAAEHGKQVLADKPMALSLEDCDAMIEAARKNDVRLLIGHSQSLDSGISAMRDVVLSGEIGRPIMITSSFYSEWLYRPRSREELDPATLEGSLTMRQGWVQLDIIRILGGGKLRSVRGMTVIADNNRPVDGAYAAYLEFEDGTPATASFDAYGHFDSSEIAFGLGLFGRPRTKNVNLNAHERMKSFATREDEFVFKDSTRVGGSRARSGADAPITKHQMFGMTIVSCERGAVRQTPEGVMIYGRDEWREVKLPPRIYAAVELDRLYDAWANDKPLAAHDGLWGKATTESALALIESARTRREILLEHQVAYGNAN